MKSKKGSKFEREIATTLSLWWTNNERDDIFWRTQGSGARATTRSKQKKTTKYQYGDITFTDPIGKPLIDLFLVEIKRGYTKELLLLDLLDRGKKAKDPLFLKFWTKAEIEKKQGKRFYSLLIFKRDRHQACVCFHQAFYNNIKKIIVNPVNIIKIKKPRLCIMLLDDFLQINNKNIEEILQKKIENVKIYKNKKL